MIPSMSVGRAHFRIAAETAAEVLLSGTLPGQFRLPCLVTAEHMAELLDHMRHLLAVLEAAPQVRPPRFPPRLPATCAGRCRDKARRMRAALTSRRRQSRLNSPRLGT